MEAFDPKVLTEEKSLAQIAWRSRRLPLNWFNVLTTMATAALATAYACWSRRPYSAFAEWDRLMASTGVAFAAQILGFLIAGFTIFATLTKPTLFRRMAVVQHERSRLSYLKYNFFAFVQVFIHYLCFAAFCLLCLVFGASNGAGSEIAERASDEAVMVKAFTARLVFVVLITWSIYILVVLKSFIFNTYHVVMTAIRWDFEMPEDGQRPQNGSHDQ